jgi:hypothetical protein
LKEKLVWGLKKSSYRPRRPKINDVTFSKPLLGEEMVNQLKDHLGRALTANDIAEYTGLDVKTVRKYYRDLGGIRVGSRILFFEKEFINAVQKRNEVVCPSPEGRVETGEDISDEKGSRGLGSRNAAKTRQRMAREDRHDLFS